jgi:predicted enzyme related to lactoylglutathione lyase
MSGRVVHFEIPYDDEERARRFYVGAFDWQVQRVPGGGCLLATTGPTGTGGPTGPGPAGGRLRGRAQSAAATPVPIVDVESIETVLTAVASLGGKTVAARRAVGTLWFTAYLEDPEGNVIGLWETARR